MPPTGTGPTQVPPLRRKKHFLHYEESISTPLEFQLIFVRVLPDRLLPFLLRHLPKRFRLMELALAPLASRAKDRHSETAAPSMDGADRRLITALLDVNQLSGSVALPLLRQRLRPRQKPRLRRKLRLARSLPLLHPPRKSRLTDHAVVLLGSRARVRRSEFAALSMAGAARRAITAELDATSRSVPARKIPAVPFEGGGIEMTWDVSLLYNLGMIVHSDDRAFLAPSDALYKSCSTAFMINIMTSCMRLKRLASSTACLGLYRTARVGSVLAQLTSLPGVVSCLRHWEWLAFAPRLLMSCIAIGNGVVRDFMPDARWKHDPPEACLRSRGVRRVDWRRWKAVDMDASTSEMALQASGCDAIVDVEKMGTRLIAGVGLAARALRAESNFTD